MTAEELDYERELVLVILELVRNLHSGQTLVSALTALAAHHEDGHGTSGVEPGRSCHPSQLVRRDIALVVRLIERGESIADGLQTWKRKRNSPGVSLLVAACSLHMEHGGSLTSSLGVLQSTIAADIELHDEVRTATAQSTASMVALAMLPVMGTLIFMVVDPSVVRFYVTSIMGATCLFVGLSLVTAGWRLSRTLTRKAMSI